MCIRDRSSKATPTGAVAQFAAAGKAVKKKDLGAIEMCIRDRHRKRVPSSVKLLIRKYPNPSVAFSNGYPFECIVKFARMW